MNNFDHIFQIIKNTAGKDQLQNYFKQLDQLANDYKSQYIDKILAYAIDTDKRYTILAEILFNRMYQKNMDITKLQYSEGWNYFYDKMITTSQQNNKFQQSAGRILSHFIVDNFSKEKFESILKKIQINSINEEVWLSFLNKFMEDIHKKMLSDEIFKYIFEKIINFFEKLWPRSSNMKPQCLKLTIECFNNFINLYKQKQRNKLDFWIDFIKKISNFTNKLNLDIRQLSVECFLNIINEFHDEKIFDAIYIATANLLSYSISALELWIEILQKSKHLQFKIKQNSIQLYKILQKNIEKLNCQKIKNEEIALQSIYALQKLIQTSQGFQLYRNILLSIQNCGSNTKLIYSSLLSCFMYKDEDLEYLSRIYLAIHYSIRCIQELYEQNQIFIEITLYCIYIFIKNSKSYYGELINYESTYLQIYHSSFKFTLDIFKKNEKSEIFELCGELMYLLSEVFSKSYMKFFYDILDAILLIQHQTNHHKQILTNVSVHFIQYFQINEVLFHIIRLIDKIGKFITNRPLRYICRILLALLNKISKFDQNNDYQKQICKKLIIWAIQHYKQQKIEDLALIIIRVALKNFSVVDKYIIQNLFEITKISKVDSDQEILQLNILLFKSQYFQQESQVYLNNFSLAFMKIHQNPLIRIKYLKTLVKILDCIQKYNEQIIVIFFGLFKILTKIITENTQQSLNFKELLIVCMIIIVSKSQCIDMCLIQFIKVVDYIYDKVISCQIQNNSIQYQRFIFSGQRLIICILKKYYTGNEFLQMLSKYKTHIVKNKLLDKNLIIQIDYQLIESIKKALHLNYYN